MDENSLAHTKWNCKYHVVFAPKYRRKIIYKQLKVNIGKIIRMLCERKGIKIIEAELCSDHINMLISIPPKMSVAGAIGYIKGKNTKAIQEYIANQLKEDKMYDDMSRKEYIDPFTGKKAKQFLLFK